MFSKERAVTTEDESSVPVVVPADVLEGLEAVRQSGAHMVEWAHVFVLAKRMGYRQTVRWVEDNRTNTCVGSITGS